MFNRPQTRTLMTGLLATSALAIASHAGAATYTDIVLADNPDFYWNMDDLTAGVVNNLGSEGNGPDVVPGLGRNQLLNENAGGNIAFNPGTTNAGGLSLGNTADFAGTTSRLFSTGVLTGGVFNQYVIEFWMKTEKTDSQYLLWHGNSGAAVIHGFDSGSGDNGLEMFDGAARTGADGPKLGDGDWHHVVIGIDSAAVGGGHTFFVNGVEQSAQTEIVAAWASSNMWLGGSDAGNPFDGQIDELAVYNTDSAGLAALSAQVATHYDAVPEPSSLALLALGGLAMVRRRRA